MLAWVLALSAFTLALTLLDKWAASRGRRRVRESTLLWAAFAGGSAGLVVGMLVARHKVRKPSFVAAVFVILLFHALLAYGAWSAGWL